MKKAVMFVMKKKYLKNSKKSIGDFLEKKIMIKNIQ